MIQLYIIILRCYFLIGEKRGHSVNSIKSGAVSNLYFNLRQPRYYVRPIVRGKETKSVEFGSKAGNNR